MPNAGHRTIIAGYYDAPVDDLDGWLNAARETGGVDGVMYTTWQNNYNDIESFAERGKFKPAEKPAARGNDYAGRNMLWSESLAMEDESDRR